MRNFSRVARYAQTVLTSVVVLTIVAGCATERTARKGGKGAVEGMMEGFADVDPEVRKKIHDAYFSDVNLRQAARDLTSAIVLGTADGLQQAHLDKMAEGAVAATMSTLRKEGGQTLSELAAAAGPQMEEALRTAIRDSILTAGSALRQSAQKDLAVATQILVKAAIDASLDSFTRFGKSIADGTTDYATNKLAPAAGVVSRTMMREALVGMQEGIDQMNLGGGGKQKTPLRAIMREVGAGLSEGMKAGVADNGKFETLLISGMVVLAGTLFTVLIGGYILWRRYRQTTKSLMIFARKMNETNKEDVQAQSLRKAIMDAHAEKKHDAWLSDFLAHRGI